VLYATKCKDRVKSLVEWKPAAQYDIEATEPLFFLRDLTQSASALMQAGDIPTSERFTITEQELGFIRFTAESVLLDIKLEESSMTDGSVDEESATGNSIEDQCSSGNDTYSDDESIPEISVRCPITNALGRTIGIIGVPVSWLLGKDTRRCEFILLSIYMESLASDTCQEILQDDPDDPVNYYRWV